jgi:hypothetical protein
MAGFAAAPVPNEGFSSVSLERHELGVDLQAEGNVLVKPVAHLRYTPPTIVRVGEGLSTYHAGDLCPAPVGTSSGLWTWTAAENHAIGSGCAETVAAAERGYAAWRSGQRSANE